MRRTCFIHAALVFAALAGCSLADELDGEPCAVAKDCWHTQECGRTSEEEQLELPGVCVSRGTGCVPGRQLGCACDPLDYDKDCLMAALPVAIDYPAMICDEVRRVCVLESDESGVQP